MRKKLKKDEITEALAILAELYPDARAELNYTTELDLLVATILSAQCTDVRVNIVTEELFKVCKTPEDYISLGEEKLGEMIRTCGFFNTKSKNIIGACMKILKDYNGEVPNTIEELMTLPGVGKKTANVVASNVFGIQAIAVDTHVFRVSNRIGLVNAKNVEKTEEQLMKVVPEEEWTNTHHRIIFHGRRVCRARNPLCNECRLNELCIDYRFRRK